MTINYHNAEFLTSYFDAQKVDAPIRPEILFVGRSNVGKSSMLNKILNRKSLARTSATPGKTVAINFFNIDNKVYFVDLPGYGYAKRSKSERKDWGILMNDYLKSKRDIRLIVFLVDIRHKPSNEDHMMYEYLLSSNFLFTVVATKADKLSKKNAEAQIDYISKQFMLRAIPFSSVTGAGVEELKQIIQDVSQNNDEV